MRPLARRLPVALGATLLTALASVGCDTPTAPAVPNPASEATLTADQRRSLLSALAALSAAATGPLGDGAARDAAAAATAETRTEPCEQGGTVTVTTVTANAAGGTVRVAPRGCRVQADDGRLWTVDGEPDFQVTVAATTTGADPARTLELTIDQSGAFRASTPGVAGRCQMALHTVVRLDLATGSGSMHTTGRLNGMPVDERTVFEAPGQLQTVDSRR